MVAIRVVRCICLGFAAVSAAFCPCPSPAQGSATYPAWVEGATYHVGDIVSYGGFDYQALVLQTDWVGAHWDPADTPSLWKKLRVDGSSPPMTPPSSPPPVAPPVGTCDASWSAATAYPGGATVSYNGINYKANWWTPGQQSCGQQRRKRIGPAMDADSGL